MKVEQENWLEEYAVDCRVFKGRWSIRHCVRMHNDIRDLKIRMSSRFKGKVARYESTYNPCSRCKVLAHYLSAQCEGTGEYDRSHGTHGNQAWAV